VELKEAELLRVFIGEGDRHDGRPLHEVLVEEARDAGLSGATVFRGIIGYGAHGRVHTSKILRLAEDLPLVVEIIDTEGRIEAFLGRVSELVTEGLVTVETIRYAHLPGQPG
jgi:PII-like signaling protein